MLNIVHDTSDGAGNCGKHVGAKRQDCGDGDGCTETFAISREARRTTLAICISSPDDPSNASTQTARAD